MIASFLNIVRDSFPASLPFDAPRLRLFQATVLVTLTIVLLNLAISEQVISVEKINPFPRPVLEEGVVKRLDFKASNHGWKVEKNAELTESAEGLVIESLGVDPILNSGPIQVDSEVEVRVRMRTWSKGPAQIFWTTPNERHVTEARSVRFSTIADGESREYRVRLPFIGKLAHIRLDPSASPGKIILEGIEFYQRKLHPIEIRSLEVFDDRIEAEVFNFGPNIRAKHQGDAVELPTNAVTKVTQQRTSSSVISTERVALAFEKLPEVSRSIVLARGNVSSSTRQQLLSEVSEWPALQNGEFEVRVSPEGFGALVFRNEKPVGLLAPLAARENHPVQLRIRRENNAIVGDAEGVTWKLSTSDDFFQCEATGTSSIQSTTVRLWGGLEQGLLAGVEHLGKNEASSSTLDLRGAEHLRYEPDPMLLTMPLASFVSDRASVAMLWEDSALRPSYATPNFYEGTAEHRMSLTGNEIRTKLFFGGSFSEGLRLENQVLWALRNRGGLPKLQDAPRSRSEQLQFCLRSLRESGIQRDGKWFHAINPGFNTLPDQPHRFSDFLSTVFRLENGVDTVSELALGGSHIQNEAIFLVATHEELKSGDFTALEQRVAAWKARLDAEAKNYRDASSDGAYYYDGKFREGHFENTASGVCGLPAWKLLRHAQLTGDQDSLAAGLRTLEYMKKFRTPRGASVWECPLHAPDLLASAHLVRAYILGYELTQNKEYLDLAVRWGVSGIPYVYQWSNRPTMLYATTGTLCATHFEAPVWIGRPVQWMGVVYADALLDLVPHDKTVDWTKLAEGILRSAQQQQYSEGLSQGLLADSLSLADQQLLPADINPCALVSLQLRLDDQPNGIYSAVVDGKRIVAPYPVRAEKGELFVTGPAGQKYVIVMEGGKIKLVEGTVKVSEVLNL